MNKRIVEMVKQTRFELRRDGEIYTSRLEHLPITEDIEKLTQLIVEECVSTLKDMHMWQSVNNQNYPGAWHDAVDQGIEAIKERFEVK